jgi:3-oxoacyl-[acyl-carrier-protein] synthase-3
MNASAVLAGIGSSLPPRLVRNADLAAELDTSDEWIRSRTGITQRYFATTGMATSDLAVAAGAKALKSAGEAAVDSVIVATATPDFASPATAPLVATKLGLTGVAAFDVNAVCTGFVYALACGAGLIAGGIAGRVLVIGADTYSTLVDPQDRATSVIFGDGAGAVVLRAGGDGEDGVLGPFDLGSDGDGCELIAVRAPGSRQRLSGADAKPSDFYFTMAGKEVFWRAVLRMAGSTKRVLGMAGWTMQDVDWLFSHQANLRIQNSLVDSLGLPRARSFSNIAQVGNTAAASIPLALDQAHEAGVLSPGNRVVLTAFGGGLTWGSTVLSWPRLSRD